VLALDGAIDRVLPVGRSAHCRDSVPQLLSSVDSRSGIYPIVPIVVTNENGGRRVSLYIRLSFEVVRHRPGLGAPDQTPGPNPYPNGNSLVYTCELPKRPKTKIVNRT
jgi:hypothetical protein